MPKRLTSIEWLEKELTERGALIDLYKSEFEYAKLREKDEKIQFAKDWYYANVKCTAPISPEDFYNELN